MKPYFDIRFSPFNALNIPFPTSLMDHESGTLCMSEHIYGKKYMRQGISAMFCTTFTQRN